MRTVPIEISAATYDDGRTETFDPPLVVQTLTGLGLWDAKSVTVRLAPPAEPGALIAYDGPEPRWPSS